MADRHLVGYCNRCGGDCFDDGKTHFHKCPPKWPNAEIVVQIKIACDKALQAAEKRPWAKNLAPAEYEDLMVSLRALRIELDRVAPQMTAASASVT